MFMGFIAFCLTASSIYVINDYKDIHADRNHPEKKHRALASGAISKNLGLLVSILCISTGMVIGYFTEQSFFFILIFYFVLNIAYTFGLKSISILDVIIVATGFVIRVKGGGLITGIFVSEWLIIMIFLLALFMALAKRRDDILIKIQSGMDMRKTVKDYNLEFLTTTLSMISGIIVVAYLIYTISEDARVFNKNNQLFYTTVFVLAGMIRYNQIIYVEKKSGSPTEILYRDKFIITTLIGWIASFFYLIYRS